MKTKDLAIIALLILSLIMWGSVRHYRTVAEDAKVKNNLLEAQADTIRKKWNGKAKQWEFSRLQYEANERQLRDFLKDKDAELYELAKRKDVRDVTKTELVVVRDTIVPTVVKDGVNYATITDKWMEAHIVSRADSTSLKQRINLPLTISKGYDGRITVATPVPYVEIVDLKGFTKIEPDRKRNWKYWVGGIIGGALVYVVVK